MARDVLTAERLGEVYRVCVTVDVDPDELFASGAAYGIAIVRQAQVETPEAG